MAINLDPAPTSAAPAGRLDRHDPKARQDQWMFEMERAMLTSSGRKQDDAGSDQAMPALAVQDGPAQPAGSAAAHAGGRAAQAQTQRAAMHAGPGADGQPADDAGASRSDTATGAAPAQDQARPDGARPVANSILPGALQAYAGAAAHGAGTAGAAPEAFVQAYRAAALTGETSSGAGRASVDPAAAVQRPATPAFVSLGVSAGPPAAPDDGAPALPDLGTSESSAGGAASFAEAPEFDKRLMRLFVQADGVHAYIRDAELGAAQMRSVAQALAVQLADSGQALAALTVNGQRIAGRAGAPDGQADEAPAASHFFSQPFSPVRKGLPE